MKTYAQKFQPKIDAGKLTLAQALVIAAKAKYASLLGTVNDLTA